MCLGLAQYAESRFISQQEHGCQGGWRLGRRGTKGKAGPPRPSYLGSLNGFQIKAEGLPWTHSRKGCFPGNLLASPSPRPQRGKARPRSRAWQPPQPAQLVALFTFPAQANPGSPSGVGGTRGRHPPAGLPPHSPPPREKQAGPRVRQQQTRQEWDACKPPGRPHLLCGAGGWRLNRASSGCPRFHSGWSI